MSEVEKDWLEAFIKWEESLMEKSEQGESLAESDEWGEPGTNLFELLQRSKSLSMQMRREAAKQDRLASKGGES